MRRHSSVSPSPWSLPVWGEKIEMGLREGLTTGRKSLPVRGEEIEIFPADGSAAGGGDVSPRAGRVD